MTIRNSFIFTRSDLMWYRIHSRTDIRIRGQINLAVCITNTIAQRPDRTNLVRDISHTIVDALNGTPTLRVEPANFLPDVE